MTQLMNHPIERLRQAGRWLLAMLDDDDEVAQAASDPVSHPPHYTAPPSGVECIEIAEHFGFCLGNAIKYIWRAGRKGDAIEDLRKARFYLDREIMRREFSRGRAP